ncbi:MAG TPA: 4Fe-4S dicluster domain-containing protein [bacterium]|nr:4Fe-4S binding protein [bacterium]HDP99913.1 4Fe-4S dicluster domain-containing protein [bacterium]
MEKKKQLPRIEIKKEWCKGCEICVDFCPTHVLAMNGPLVEVVNIDACTGCGLCEIRCPDFAIKVIKPEKKK